MAANKADVLMCLLLEQKARSLPFLLGWHGGKEEEMVKSVSNVCLSRLLRSVLKMWVLKFSAWSIFVRV